MKASSGGRQRCLGTAPLLVHLPITKVARDGVLGIRVRSVEWQARREMCEEQGERKVGQTNLVFEGRAQRNRHCSIATLTIAFSQSLNPPPPSRAC